MARPQVGVGGTASIWRVAANILNKQSRTPEKGWSSSLVLGDAKIPHRDHVSSYKTFIQ